MRTYYEVTVSHPTNFHTGIHRIEVVRTPKYGNPDVVEVSVRGSKFGCGRDQFGVTDHEAIEAFLAEHACSVVKITRI